MIYQDHNHRQKKKQNKKLIQITKQKKSTKAKSNKKKTNQNKTQIQNK